MPETLEDLTNVMFKTFARCEYALKAAGYHGNVGPATPNWQKFARTISEHFVDPSDQEFKEAIDYILRRPPKKQVVRDGRLAWSEAEPDHQNQADLVLSYVRRVRNNLFHGGKFNGQWFEPQRSEELLRHSLTILIHCLERSVDVRAAYDG